MTYQGCDAYIHNHPFMYSTEQPTSFIGLLYTIPMGISYRAYGMYHTCMHGIFSYNYHTRIYFFGTIQLYKNRTMNITIIHTKSCMLYVIGFWKTVPNHTFLFQYIYHCNMKSIAFPIIRIA